MHQKISYEIFSERGKYHEEQGKENEDAINVVTNGDYIFAILSDGAGSSKFAKEAAQTTVKAASDYCYTNSQAIFVDSENEVKKMIFDLQQKLDEKATDIGTTLSKMISTLVILCIDKNCKKYMTIHVGDGLVAQADNDKWKIISFPENGPTNKYTYFTNSPLVFKHLRINFGKFDVQDEFFVSTDGYFENCCFTEQYINKISCNKETDNGDDVTYCKIDFQML